MRYSSPRGVTAIAWQGHEAEREAIRADVEAKKANAVKDFLLDIFKQSSLRNPNGAQARHVTAEELLDIGAQRIKVQLRDQPEVRGELLDTLGQTLRRTWLSRPRCGIADRAFEWD